MNVGILILNWNGFKNTIACLKSIICSDQKSNHIVVVDNGSVDHSVKEIVRWAKNKEFEPSILQKVEGNVTIGFNTRQLIKSFEIICLEKNLGYGGGNNIGVYHLIEKKIDYIFVLNNDMELFPDTVKALELFLNRNQQAGIVGCDILDIESRTQLPNGSIDYWLGVHFLKKFKHVLKGAHETNFVPGCAMLIRKDVFKQVGHLNEEYFLYADDIEFCHRVKKHGWKLYINFDSKIKAHISASSGGRRSTIYYYFVVRNTLRFINTELSNLQKVVSFVAFILARILQIIQWVVLLKWEHIDAAIHGFYDFYKGVNGVGYARKFLKELEKKVSKYGSKLVE